MIRNCPALFIHDATRDILLRATEVVITGFVIASGEHRHAKIRRCAPSLYNRCSSVGRSLLPWLGHPFFDIVEDGIGRFDLLLRFGFEHFAQAKAQAVEYRQPSYEGAGSWSSAIALGSERLQCPFGGQARIGQRRAKRRVLLRMGLRLLTEGLRRPADDASSQRGRPLQVRTGHRGT